jgi:hypothetical protein
LRKGNRDGKRIDIHARERNIVTKHSNRLRSTGDRKVSLNLRIIWFNKIKEVIDYYDTLCGWIFFFSVLKRVDELLDSQISETQILIEKSSQTIFLKTPPFFLLFPISNKRIDEWCLPFPRLFKTQTPNKVQ